VIPVKVPSPERYLLHKLFAAQSRRSDRARAAAKRLENLHPQGEQILLKLAGIGR